MQNHQITPRSNRFECHLPVQKSGLTAIELLAENCPLSKQQLKVCFANGAVWLQKGKQKQRIRRVKKNVFSGEILHLYYDADIISRQPLAATLIRDLQQYSVWHKPAGMLAQGSLWGDHCSLLRVAECFFSPPRPVFLVHRLDREAFGIMIVAHKASAAAQLSQLFQQRQIEKHYAIRVHGHVTEKDLTVRAELAGKSAVTHLSLTRYDADSNTSHLAVNIETGRKHQIRQHCQLIGYPVLGDRIYGIPDGHTLQLQAKRLRFHCPISKQQQAFELPDLIDSENS